MSGLPASSRPIHFKPGAWVQHASQGVGIVLGEWSSFPIGIGGPCDAQELASGKGIYDVVFMFGSVRWVHCCRGEYLQRIADQDSKPKECRNTATKIQHPQNHSLLVG
jgi:hypothetical protein